MSCYPESAYIFLTLLNGGQAVLKGIDENEPKVIMNKRNVLDTAQDMLYRISNGKNIPPKQYSLRNTLHQATQDKQIVRLINQAGHVMTYEDTLASQTAIAEKSLENTNLTTKAVVPRNCIV